MRAPLELVDLFPRRRGHWAYGVVKVGWSSDWPVFALKRYIMSLVALLTAPRVA